MADALSDAERLLATIVAARSRVAALTGDHLSTAEQGVAAAEDCAAADTTLDPHAPTIEPTELEDDDTAEIELPKTEAPSQPLVLGLTGSDSAVDPDADWALDQATSSSVLDDLPLSDEPFIEPEPPHEAVDRANTIESEEIPEDTRPADLPPEVSDDIEEEDPFSFLDLIPPAETTPVHEEPEKPSHEAPPIRPKPIMPIVAAMAAAAPPTLSQPKAVAPRILDPNRPSLEVDVVEVEVDEVEESFENIGPVPQLTEQSAAPVRHISRRTAPPTEAVFDAMTSGMQALSSGNLKDACSLFSDVIDWSGNRMDARLARGRCLRDLGDNVGAMSDFMVAESIAPHAPEPHFEMGDLFFARKDYERAIAHYTDALVQSPEHAMAYCRRGMSHHYQRRSDLALEDLRLAQTIDPNIHNIERYVQMVANVRS